MNQQQFQDYVDQLIVNAKESFPHNQEFYLLVQDYIKTIKTLKENTTENFEDVVFPSFPAV